MLLMLIDLRYNLFVSLPSTLSPWGSELLCVNEACMTGDSFGHLFHWHLNPFASQGRSSNVR